ncbi:MAG: pyridoxamine 5'-phosphate oxidase family protein [Parvibaculum sp.]
MSEIYPTKKPFRARRVPKRAHYDEATVHSVLDEGLVAHVAYVADDEDGPRPVVIPVYYARRGEEFLFHASTKSGLGLAVKAGMAMCASVTLLNGIIYARSGFHHSMNYRSVVLHGTPSILTGDEKLAALDYMVDRLVPGRAAHVRPMSAKEIKATLVVSLPLLQVVAKVNAAEVPNEEPDDLTWPVWAGIMPVHTLLGVPQQHAPCVSDEACPDGGRSWSLSD